ncbi:hypothetical protein RFI_11354, partial [Reticulomyxa filosa]
MLDTFEMILEMKMITIATVGNGAVYAILWFYFSFLTNYSTIRTTSRRQENSANTYNSLALQYICYCAVMMSWGHSILFICTHMVIRVVQKVPMKHWMTMQRIDLTVTKQKQYAFQPSSSRPLSFFSSSSSSLVRINSVNTVSHKLAVTEGHRANSLVSPFSDEITRAHSTDDNDSNMNNNNNSNNNDNDNNDNNDNNNDNNNSNNNNEHSEILNPDLLHHVEKTQTSSHIISRAETNLEMVAPFTTHKPVLRQHFLEIPSQAHTVSSVFSSPPLDNNNKDEIAKATKFDTVETWVSQSQKLSTLSLQDIFDNRQLFSAFVQHVTSEFTMENLLCF